MPVLSNDVSLADSVRFRDDNPDLFGVQIGEKQCDEMYMHGLRDHLCNSVELVPELFPEIARTIDQVRQDLLPAETIRGFISSDPTPQAWCIGGSENRTMILGVTSGLIQLMDIDELKFVIGHEIGHYIMGHHRRTPPESEGVDSINFRSLQRMAEISADRVGFLACPRADASFRAILKTASGLGERHVRFDVAAFSAQFQRLKELKEKKQGNGHSAYSTHPLLTVRCRALSLFATSQPYVEVTGRIGDPELSRNEMDDKIAGDMYDSTGYHPMSELENSVRLNLIWLVLRLFIEDQRFTKPEQAFLLDNFEGEIAEKAIEFVRSQGPDAVRKKYEEALTTLGGMNESARNSACAVIRRVASVASGAGSSQKDIKRLLKEIHKRLDCKVRARVKPWADEQSLAGLLELG
jgi:Peptidase family M48